MKSNELLLIRTLLKSTSLIQFIKTNKEKKKKNRAIGNIVGVSILYVMLLVYCVAMAVGYGEIGIVDSIPALSVLAISTLSFFMTLFKTNGYLFNFKEYDMLMSLPFEPKTIASAKFMYMYIKSLPWNMSISLAMMIGYGIYAKPNVIVYIIWIVLGCFIPVIPMLVASFVGFLFAKISSQFKKTNIVQTILTIAFIILCMCSRFIIEPLFKDTDQIEATLENISAMIDGIGKGYWPIAWFSGAITNVRVSDMLLLIGVSILLYELIFIPVGRSYRQINSALKSHAAAKEFVMTAQKSRSLVNSIAFKEFRRMIGSTTYMTNAVVGEVLVLILSVVVLFVGLDGIIEVVTQGAPVSSEMIYPAIPLIIYFLIGMVATTAITPSLEGKNYWIVQSLPLDKKVLYQGKMLFNMYLTVPFMLLGILTFSISAKAPLANIILYVIEGIVLCAFSTAWGCVCGIKHMRLDWVNEIEVVKQGAAVAIYLFPNMFITMILVVLVVFLGLHMNGNLLSVILTLLVGLLAFICYRRVISLCKRQ